MTCGATLLAPSQSFWISLSVMVSPVTGFTSPAASRLISLRLSVKVYELLHVKSFHLLL